jgi:thymidine phosphorylase
LGSKLSSGVDAIVFNIKCGNDSFIKEMEKAKQLSRMIT